MAWFRAGFLVEKLIDLRRKGLSPNSARTSIGTATYSSVFKRIGPGRFHVILKFLPRAKAVVRCLDLPHYRQSSMFSSADSTVSWLDGGLRSHEGYGWGSSYWTAIIGDNATDFLCYRMGVQPRRRKRSDGEARSRSSSKRCRISGFTDGTN